MVIKLDIQNDKELRTYIKDMIKGQVTSIAREEIKEIISEIVDKKFLPKTKEEIEKMIRDYIKYVVNDKLGFNYSAHGIDIQLKYMFKEIATELLIKKFNEMIKEREEGE